jgi:hypothetical protein
MAQYARHTRLGENTPPSQPTARRVRARPRANARKEARTRSRQLSRRATHGPGRATSSRASARETRAKSRACSAPFRAASSSGRPIEGSVSPNLVSPAHRANRSGLPPRLCRNQNPMGAVRVRAQRRFASPPDEQIIRPPSKDSARSSQVIGAKQHPSVGRQLRRRRRARQKDDDAREEEKLTRMPHTPSATSENSTHHGMDRPSSVQSTLPHSPEPVSTFVTTCVTGMISSR